MLLQFFTIRVWPSRRLKGDTGVRLPWALPQVRRLKMSETSIVQSVCEFYDSLDEAPRELAIFVGVLFHRKNVCTNLAELDMLLRGN